MDIEDETRAEGRRLRGRKDNHRGHPVGIAGSKTAATKPRAYSYLRFSTAEQRKGDSTRRQSEAAERYAAAHGLELSDQSYRDLGISAFRGANQDTGRLGEFLTAVEHGDIPKGSYLLVESLDRISRQSPRKAIKVLERICEAGVTLVTLEDSRSYTEESLDDDPMSLMLALMVAMRANEESRRKGERVAAAWSSKRKRADREKLTKKCPAWLQLRDDRLVYDVLKDRAAVVRRIYREALDGKGQHAIAEGLNADRVPTFGDGTRRAAYWHRSYVKKILENDAVVGRYQPHKIEHYGLDKRDKRRVPDGDRVEGYYPAIISLEDFERLRARTSGNRRNAHGRSSTGVSSLLAGLARCPRCGGTMTRVNKGARGGSPYLVCTLAKSRRVDDAGKPACEYRSVKLEAVERALLADQKWIREAPTGSTSAHLEKRRLLHENHVNEVMIENVLDALARSPSAAVRARLNRLEAHRAQLRAAIEDADKRIEATAINVVKARLLRLSEVLATEPLEVDRANALMRESLNSVTVDWARGRLVLRWLQGSLTRVPFEARAR